MSEWNGLWVTTVSPFDQKGRLDEELAEEHAAHLAQNEISNLIPGGNTGEFFSLSPDEMVTLVQATRRAAPRAAVLAGVGGGLRTVVKLVERCMDAGADGVMVHEPIQTYVSTRGLDDYFRQISVAAEGRVLLYKRSQRITDDLLLRLVREGVAKGVKYAVNDLIRFERACAAEKGATWVCGTAELWAPFFHLVGASGFTSGLANAAPRLATAMQEALRDGDIRRAMHVRTLASEFELLRAEDGGAKNVPAVRSAMEHVGFVVGPPRPPLTPLPRDDKARIRRIWQTWEEAGLVLQAPQRAGRR